MVNYYSEGAAGYIMQVKNTPSWPRSWANFSLLQTVFPRELLAILELLAIQWPSWANLHMFFFWANLTLCSLHHMKAYTDEVDRQNYYVSPADPPTAGYFTPAVVYTSLTALDNAIQNATSTGETMPRAKVVPQIAALRVSPWLVALSNWGALCAYATARSLPWPLEVCHYITQPLVERYGGCMVVLKIS